MKGKRTLCLVLSAIVPGLGHIVAGKFKRAIGILGVGAISHVPPFSLIGGLIRVGTWCFSFLDILADKDLILEEVVAEMNNDQSHIKQGNK